MNRTDWSWRTLVPAALATGCAALLPTAAHAQFGIEGLVTQLNEIRFFSSCWNTRDPLEGDGGCPRGKRGFGVEAVYSMRPIPWPGTPTRVTRGRADTTGGSVKCDAAGRCDTTTTFTRVRPDTAPIRYLQLELAVGYSQFSGFSVNTPGLEVRGAARELPAVSLYGAGVFGDAPGLLRSVSPYLAVHSGIIQLHNLSMYAPSDAGDLLSHTGAGTTFQLGASGGVSVSLGPSVRVYYGAGAYYRKFPGVQWSPTSGTNRVPATLPRTLDFSGLSQAVGVQVRIRSPQS